MLLQIYIDFGHNCYIGLNIKCSKVFYQSAYLELKICSLTYLPILNESVIKS